MLDWIRDDYAIISVLIKLGMLIVWIVYLQLFLVSYKRRTRPKILINMGGGRGIDAMCLLSNMSSEPVYVESLIATLEGKGKQWVCPVTDVEALARDDQPPNPLDTTRQGPLEPGEVRDIGSFRNLIRHVLDDKGGPDRSGDDIPDDITGFEIQAIADFGPDDLLVGAKRRFGLDKRDGEWVLKPHSAFTVQIRSRRERERVNRMLEELDS
jgi:hypothetical protein